MSPSPLPASILRRILGIFDGECEGKYARIHKLLTLSRVCRAWKPIAEEIAFRNVDLQIGDGRPLSERLLAHLWTNSAHASRLRVLEVDVFLANDTQTRRITLASFASLLVSLSAYRDLSANEARGLGSLSITFSYGHAKVDLAELRVVSTALRAFDSLRRLQIHADVTAADADDGDDAMDCALADRVMSAEDGFLAVDSLQIGNEDAFDDDEESEISFAFARSVAQTPKLKRLSLFNVAHVDVSSWWYRMDHLEEL